MSEAPVLPAEELAEQIEAKRRFRTYTDYRNTDIQLVGRIPSHWSDKRLKYLVTINPDKLPDKTEPDFELEYVDIGNVSLIDGITSTEHLLFENAPSRARRLVKDGDTVISTVRTYLKAVAPIKLPPPNLVVSTGFAVLRPGPEFDRDYLYRLAQGESLVQRVVAHSVGVSYPAINAADIGFLEVPLPPLDEQQAISTFLDRETKKIDELIEKKERLIHLLQEKRTALISQAVTKGLNPDVKMKSSGLQWLHEVPAHWTERKLGYIVTMQGGSTPSKSNDLFWNGTIPWVSPKDMKRRDIADSQDHVTELALELTTLKLLPPGIVLMVVRGMILAHTFPIGLTTVPVTINQDMKALGPKNVCSPNYLAYILQGLSGMMLGLLVEESAHGTKVLRTDVWKGVKLFLPPPEEQDSICRDIERLTAEVDALANRIEDAINSLREYRTALISAAVTGQIDVRGEV